MFFPFNVGDIFNTSILTTPSYNIKSGSYGYVSGTVYLFNSSSVGQSYQGYSAKENLVVTRPLATASIRILDAERSVTGSNFQIFASINNLYRFYHNHYPNIYTASFSGTTYDRYRVLDIPEIFYWTKLHSGSINLIDYSGSGLIKRTLYDNGLGGLLKSGSNDVFIGNVFYSEGIIVLKDPDTWTWGTQLSGTEVYAINFSGTNEIPVKMFRCRMPAGELNFSNNPSFILSGSSEFKGNMISHFSASAIYVTGIGLYNKRRELVAQVKLAQPIEKKIQHDIMVKLRMDF